MLLALGLAFFVAWQAFNLWRQPQSLPMRALPTAPLIKDAEMRFGSTAEGTDSASRAPSQTTSSPLVADGANPVAAAPKAPLGDVADAEPQKQASPQVDETALRYFARQGDTRRLNVEIARLRPLYPDWTPPENPLKPPAVVDSQLDHMSQLFGKGQFAGVRDAIAARQSVEPGWTPPQNLVDLLALADVRAPR